MLAFNDKRAIPLDYMPACLGPHQNLKAIVKPISAGRTTVRRVPRHGRASKNAPVSSETSVGTSAFDFLSAFFGSPDAYGSSKIFRLPAGQL